MDTGRLESGWTGGGRHRPGGLETLRGGTTQEVAVHADTGEALLADRRTRICRRSGTTAVNTVLARSISPAKYRARLPPFLFYPVLPLPELDSWKSAQTAHRFSCRRRRRACCAARRRWRSGSVLAHFRRHLARTAAVTADCCCHLPAAAAPTIRAPPYGRSPY